MNRVLPRAVAQSGGKGSNDTRFYGVESGDVGQELPRNKSVAFVSLGRTCPKHHRKRFQDTCLFRGYLRVNHCCTRCPPYIPMNKMGGVHKSLAEVGVVVVVVVVVDSHIQRIVLATEETTVTQQVSHRPIKCQPACVHKEVRRSTGHIMVTTRYSDQQGSESRQKVMRLYKQWHRPTSKRFIKPPYSISRATSIDLECCRLPTTRVLSKKTEKLRSNQF